MSRLLYKILVHTHHNHPWKHQEGAALGYCWESIINKATWCHSSRLLWMGQNERALWVDERVKMWGLAWGWVVEREEVGVWQGTEVAYMFLQGVWYWWEWCSSTFWKELWEFGWQWSQRAGGMGKSWGCMKRRRGNCWVRLGSRQLANRTRQPVAGRLVDLQYRMWCW
jgi:hypothetical protein